MTEKENDYQGYAEWREWWHEREGMLSENLSQSVVKTRQQAGRSLSYIEGWHAIAEANRIFGFGDWSRETVYCKEVSREQNEKGNYVVGYEAKVRIHAPGVIRDGTGHGSGISPRLFDAIEGAAKEAETDAMKRAMMTFGNPFGLALYDKEKANVGKTKEQIAEEAEAELQQRRAKDERFAEAFAQKLNSVDALEALQSGIDKNRERLDSIKKDFPEIHDMIKREIDKTYKRVTGE